MIRKPDVTTKQSYLTDAYCLENNTIVLGATGQRTVVAEGRALVLVGMGKGDKSGPTRPEVTISVFCRRQLANVNFRPLMNCLSNHCANWL